MTITGSRLYSSLALFAITASAWAGPEFDEGATDAGSTPPTSKSVSSSSGSAVTKVRGTTTTAALLGGGDLVDLYRVKTGTDTSTFKVDMNMVSGGEPVWGARLCLFKKQVVTCGAAGTPQTTVTIARPVATVVKADANRAFPIFDGAKQLVNGGGATLGSILSPNTEYYISVGGSTNLPQGYREDCNGSSLITFFGGTDGLGQYMASASDALCNLTGWNGVGTAAGPYGMSTAGIVTVAASDCSSAMEIEGSPLVVPYAYALAPLVNLPGVSCAPTWLTSRQFFYIWEPQCTGTAHVSTCTVGAPDTAIEVFEIDACNPDPCAAATGVSIACNDQCGSGNGSRVEFPVTLGHRYLVWMPRVSGTGNTGSVTFTCTALPPSGDVNGDGLVNALDLSIILGQWTGN
jgi:hypothetical protein